MKAMLEALRNLGPDWTAFILSMQVALVMGFLEYSKTTMILVCVGIYCFLRFVQRPWTDYDDKSL
jgi:hypothetical protein